MKWIESPQQRSNGSTMKNYVIAAFIASAFIYLPADAQIYSNPRNAPPPYAYNNGPIYATPGTVQNYSYPYGRAYPYSSPYSTPYSPYYGVPQPIGGGAFGITSGGVNWRMWQAPSGYYYPWMSPLSYGEPVIYVAPPAQQKTKPEPPVSTVLSDMLNFLDEQKEKKHLQASDYEHLRRRALDLQSKNYDMRVNDNDQPDAQDDQAMRKDIDELGVEVSQALRRSQ